MKISGRLRKAYRYICMPAFMLINSFTVGAQEYHLRLNVTVSGTKHINDTMYVAGSFNDWNPGKRQYQLVNTNGMYQIEIPALKEDVYQFKFTRGNWSTGEVHADGAGVENRIIKLISDTTVGYSIEAWQDDFAPAVRKHTASSQVSIIDTAFYMPQLDRYRRLWIYLPEGYAASKNKKRYPVMYMHDGQNVFDEYTAPFGEWGVDECLDSLIKNGQPPCIVVGIDCGEKRMNEYNPYDFEKFGMGEGNKYIDFLANTLKPYIDNHYRTLRGKENTIIAGSSMGGLISYYAMLSHPGVYGKAGVFSPAFWTAPEIKSYTDSVGGKLEGRIFFYIGELEGSTYVDDLKEVADNIGKRSEGVIYTVIDPLSKHNEQAWRKWFPEFYTWIMSDGFNSPVKIEK